jgi:hypothetical protein
MAGARSASPGRSPGPGRALLSCRRPIPTFHMDSVHIGADQNFEGLQNAASELVLYPRDIMSIQYLLVTYPEQRNVFANGAGVGVTNHTLLLPSGEYIITLDGEGYEPASQDIALVGTSIVRPFVSAFSGPVAGIASADEGAVDVALANLSTGAPVRRSPSVLVATSSKAAAGRPGAKSRAPASGSRSKNA